MINIGTEVLSVEDLWKSEDDFIYSVAKDIRHPMLKNFNTVRNSFIGAFAAVNRQVENDNT